MSKATDLATLISDSKDHVLFRMVPICDSEGRETGTYVNGGEAFKEVMSLMAQEAIVESEDESIRQVVRDHLEMRELQKAIAVLEEEHLWAESGKSTRKNPRVRNNLQRWRDGYGILEEALDTGEE
ncbi:hypothetical protein QFC21_006911 [Naganishia friedmannii]|uniref:Uncharacterized protein n=1 Tax=Naganishia friedmannii TaxID=89922 RepID=A0ACC2UZ85_9TREE|nr:hypothetical protein QFC21_006911 [Naganishia friedmannii]